MQRKDDDFPEICPNCGKYTGGEAICPYCGTEVFNESELEEFDEDDEGGGPPDEDEEGGGYTH